MMKIRFQTTIPAPPKVLKEYGNPEIQVNSRYLVKNGKPWLPVSGELHYSRVPRELWAAELDKIKAGGVDIVSTYIFWIHHEEIKGQFRWDGNRNLGEFLDLCRERGLEVALRVGPWAHGECRNGGHPDWIVKECGSGARHNTQPYLTYVEEYYREIARHIGNRPLFSIQIENELVNDEEHLKTLAILARECGLNAPIYTATGWGYDTSRLSPWVLPTFGGYPEQPWNQNTLPSAPNPQFFFTGARWDGLIGNDLLTVQSREEDENVPFFTCETGPGIACTYHRRPMIPAADALANEICTLGNGCNWLGLYMYHGGTNPMGQLSSMNESRATGYPNDYPVFSYDFQAPIGECGQLRESYFRLQTVHEFLRNFGEQLAPMVPVLPDVRPANLEDTEVLRCALRSDGESGFVFVNNHHHGKRLPEHRDVTLEIAFQEETLTVPIPEVPTDACFIFPVRMSLSQNLILDYALAQPVSREGNTYLFEEVEGIAPVFCFRGKEPVEIPAGASVTVENFTVRVRKKLACPPELEREIPFVQTGANTWTVTGLPEQAAVLRLDYFGNTISVSANGEMFADEYYYGAPFYVYKRQGVTSLEIQIRPLMPEDDIYLECPRQNGSALRQITISQDI